MFYKPFVAEPTSDTFSPFMYVMLGVNTTSRRTEKTRSDRLDVISEVEKSFSGSRVESKIDVIGSGTSETEDLRRNARRDVIPMACGETMKTAAQFICSDVIVVHSRAGEANVESLTCVGCALKCKFVN